MTRTKLLVGLCVLAAAGSAVGSGAGGTLQARPTVGITGTSPFEIRGAGFVPRERVQVLLAVGGRQLSKSTVASQAGIFSVAFQASLGRCGRFVVQAFGAQGSRARVLQRRQLPDCVSPTGAGPST
jgi:hypothetical protein